jgi:hypothetical protein
VNGGPVVNGCCEDNTAAQVGPTIIGNVTIHPTATVHSSAVVSFYIFFPEFPQKLSIVLIVIVERGNNYVK